MVEESVFQNLLNIRQACKILNVHPDTLRRWEKEGKINSLRLGSRRDRRYRIQDINALIKLTILDENKFENYIISRAVNISKLRKIIKNARCVLLDVGDTLMTPFPSRGDLYADIAYGHGFNLNPTTLEANWNRLYDEWEKEKLLSDFTIYSSQKIREDLFAKFNADVLISSGLPESKKLEALEIGKEIYFAITGDPDNWRVYPGVKEFLESLKKNKKTLGILDNWNEMLHKFMKESEIGKYFEFVISGGELQVRKPEKRIFEIALEKAKMKAKETLYIGNRYIDDILGPQKVGITPILFDNKRQYLDQEFLRFYRFKDITLP